MKHMRKQGTTAALLISFLVSYLVLAPIAIDINLAQSMDTTPPVLSHHPLKMGYLGKPLKITAYVGDDSQIKSVTMAINYGGQSTTGNIPQRKGIAKVPVLVQAGNEVTIYAGPNSRYKQRGKAYADDQLNVTEKKQDFYRVKHGDITGYVKAADTKIIMTGKAYGVALPAKFTNQSMLTYQISVTDIHGNTTTSDLYQVRLLTEEEVAQLKAQAGLSKKPTVKAKPEKEPKKRSFAALWIFAGMALIGGGVYYYFSQKKDKEEITTVDVLVEWD